MDKQLITLIVLVVTLESILLMLRAGDWIQAQTDKVKAEREKIDEETRGIVADVDVFIRNHPLPHKGIEQLIKEKPMADTDLAKVNSTELDISNKEDAQELQNRALDTAAALVEACGKENVLYKPFDNQTGIQNFGHGSLASMLGHKDRVVTDATGKPETTDESKNPEQLNTSAELPTLRYLNLPACSLELKRYNSGKLVASYSTDGKTFTRLAHAASSDELVQRLFKERACAAQPPKNYKDKTWEQLAIEGAPKQEELDKIINYPVPDAGKEDRFSIKSSEASNDIVDTSAVLLHGLAKEISK